MQKSFYFLRHGQTDWNKNEIIMGQKDVSLNEEGIKQAVLAKDILSKQNISQIYSSPLTRTTLTCNIINERLKLDVKFDSLLMERKWGEYEGQHKSVRDSHLPDNAESWEEFEVRILKCFENILFLSSGIPLIISHGGVFAVLARNLLKNFEIRSDNCHPFMFEYLNDSWQIHDLMAK